MEKNKPLGQVRPAVANAADRTAKVTNISESRSSIMDELLNFAGSAADFRRTGKGNIRHPLRDIIVLIVLARMAGKVHRADIIEFGKHNLGGFRSMRLLMNGVPSEATLCRVERGIDADGLADGMSEFAMKFHQRITKTSVAFETICVDGKAMRGTELDNGRNPDIVSAYSPSAGLTLATEACREKSNEIKAAPLLLGRIDLTGKLVTADAMMMQKPILDTIRKRGGRFIVELKANQRSLLYGVEDRLRSCAPVATSTYGPELGHGRIETRTYNVYDGAVLIADKEKWGGNLTVVEYVSRTIRKKTGVETAETRLYVSNLTADTPWIGEAIRKHWSIESMHWSLDVNLRQDHIRRKSHIAARNLDTLQRLTLMIFNIWKGLRKKRSDKAKGIADLMRPLSNSFTKLLRFLSQK